MLEAKKSSWFEKVFALYNRNLLKRRFHSLRVSGLDNLKNYDSKVPLLIYANHSSWWDGLILWDIFTKCDFENYVMMEEKQLQDLFLFRYLGAFSVVRENPRQALQSINYAVRLLKENANRAVLIFPQGEILPNDARPLHFYNGLGRIVDRVGRCSIIPIALRLEFLGDFKPEIFVKIATAQNFITNEKLDTKKLTVKLETQLTAVLDDLCKEITLNDVADYEKLF